MAFQEENELYNNPYFKALCTPLEETVDDVYDDDYPMEEIPVFIESSGMFEMAEFLDAVNGPFAAKLSKGAAPLDSYAFRGFRKRTRLLHDRNIRKLARIKKEQE